MRSERFALAVGVVCLQFAAPSFADDFSDAPFSVVKRRLTPIHHEGMRLEELPSDRPYYRSDGLETDIVSKTPIGQTVSIEHTFSVSFGEIQDNPLDVLQSEIRKYIKKNPVDFCLNCDGDRPFWQLGGMGAGDVMDDSSTDDSDRVGYGLQPRIHKDRIAADRTYRWEDPGLLLVCIVQRNGAELIPESTARISFWGRYNDEYCVTVTVFSDQTTDFEKKKSYTSKFTLKANNPTDDYVTLVVTVLVFGETGGILGDEYTHVKGISNPVLTKVLDTDVLQQWYGDWTMNCPTCDKPEKEVITLSIRGGSQPDDAFYWMAFPGWTGKPAVAELSSDGSTFSADYINEEGGGGRMALTLDQGGSAFHGQWTGSDGTRGPLTGRK